MNHFKKISMTVLLTSLSLFAGGKVNYEAKMMPEKNIEKFNSTWYVGGSIGAAGVQSYYYGTDTVADIALKVGYELNQYFAVELMGSFGINDGKQLSHDYSYGFYLKPQYPIAKRYKLHALLGYARTKISFDNEFEYNGIRDNETVQNDFSYGIGVDYELSNTITFYLDAIRWIDKEETISILKYKANVDGIYLGISYRF